MQRRHYEPEHLAFADAARSFLDKEVVPHYLDWERDGITPRDVFAAAGRGGFLGMAIPEEYGGGGTYDFRFNQAFGEQVSYAGVTGTGLGLTLHNDICLPYFLAYCSDEQKQRWLPGMAALDKLGTFALTEPRHGSDSVALETSARRDGDEWVINGEKKWIGNGTLADVVVVWARDVADGQVKGFLVEKGAPGYAATRIDGKGSLRAVWQAEITLTDLRVPEENRLPGARSFSDTARVLAGTRNAVAWGALGHATAAYEIAVAYCAQRQQFGKPLCSFQIVQDRLVKMLAEICSMQLYCLRLGRLIEEGRLTDTIAAIAKMNNTRKARQVTAEARDLLGGNGILLDYHVMRHMADIESIHTYEGTETIQTLIVGRDITGVGAFA